MVTEGDLLFCGCDWGRKRQQTDRESGSYRLPMIELPVRGTDMVSVLRNGCMGKQKEQK
jgi:hypothetical protein